MLLGHVLAKVYETGLHWDDFKASEQFMVASGLTVLHLGEELQNQNQEKNRSEHWL